MKLEHLWQAIFALIGALASAYGGYWIGNQPERVGKLEYRLDSDDGLKRFFGTSGDVRLIYKGTEQADISRVNVQIANTTKKNTEKVRVYLEVKDKSRPAIIADFEVPDGYPRDVVKLSNVSEGVYAFDIEYMNRSSQFWDSAFRFSLYFTGPKSPDVNVTVAAKGLALQKYEFGRVDTLELIARVISSTWWFLAIYVAGIYAMLKYNRTRRRLREEHALEVLQDLVAKPMPDDPERSKLLSEARDRALSLPSFSLVVKALRSKSEA